MKRIAISLLIIVLFYPYHPLAEEIVNNQNGNRYEITNKECLQRGPYKVITIRAVIEGKDLTEQIIQDILRKIISGTWNLNDPHTIIVYAYKTKMDAEKAAYDFSGYVSLARALWQPQGRGDRLHSSNEKNIQDKESYEMQFDIPKKDNIPADLIVSRFDKETRKKIYYEFDEADYRAFEENEKNSPSDDIENWDKSFIKRVGIEESRIKEKFRDEIRSKYKLTINEAENIEREALLDRWPPTNHDYLYAHSWSAGRCD